MSYYYTTDPTEDYSGSGYEDSYYDPEMFTGSALPTHPRVATRGGETMYARNARLARERLKRLKLANGYYSGGSKPAWGYYTGGAKPALGYRLGGSKPAWGYTSGGAKRAWGYDDIEDYYDTTGSGYYGGIINGREYYVPGYGYVGAGVLKKLLGTVKKKVIPGAKKFVKNKVLPGAKVLGQNVLNSLI